MAAEEAAKSGSVQVLELLAVVLVSVVFLADAMLGVVCRRTHPLERIFLTMDRPDRLAALILYMECSYSESCGALENRGSERFFSIAFSPEANRLRLNN
jgi:hypothetical protein